jgi:hypothetical protein
MLMLLGRSGTHILDTRDTVDFSRSCDRRLHEISEQFSGTVGASAYDRNISSAARLRRRAVINKPPPGRYDDTAGVGAAAEPACDLHHQVVSSYARSSASR